MIFATIFLCFCRSHRGMIERSGREEVSEKVAECSHIVGLLEMREHLLYWIRQALFILSHSHFIINMTSELSPLSCQFKLLLHL